MFLYLPSSHLLSFLPSTPTLFPALFASSSLVWNPSAVLTILVSGASHNSAYCLSLRFTAKSSEYPLLSSVPWGPCLGLSKPHFVFIALVPQVTSTCKYILLGDTISHALISITTHSSLTLRALTNQTTVTPVGHVDNDVSCNSV